MAIEEIHVGDIGTVFEYTVKDAGVVVDISSATVKEITFKKPDGTKLVVTANFTSDGTDGKIRYAILTGQLNKAGIWDIQGKVVITAGTWYTDISQFQVHLNL